MKPPLEAIRLGGKRALARALAEIETRAGTDDLAGLLDEANASPKGHVIGITGPPGVGKSTLTDRLVGLFREAGTSVGVIAVDPSSRLTGGALLGDRARIRVDPGDRGVFIRSFAARDRLGGLSDETIAATVLMRALFDRVVVESVGIGQSETDVALVADTVVLGIQPASGDSLQFMKAGIMEVPDVIAVTKADLGEAAGRAKADVEGALSLSPRASGEWAPPVVTVSAATGEGLSALLAAIDGHRGHLDGARLADRRKAQERAWIDQAIVSRFGTRGLARLGQGCVGEGPFRRMIEAERRLGRLLDRD